MFINNSPLESLAAFAIAFATGAMSVIGLIRYIAKVRKDALRTSRSPWI